MTVASLAPSVALRIGPILITGSHRAGTTWVGQMLAASPRVGYIREPFNLHRRPGLSALPIRTWFTYVTRENADEYLGPMRDVLAFRYSVLRELPAVRNLRDAARMVRDAANALGYRLRGARPMVKDPIAVFSSEWLAETFDMDVVVLVRHPAAFASSVMRLGWSHPFSHFLAQPLLMRDHLERFEAEIRAFAERERPILEQAALLWRMIYTVVRTYVARHPEWAVARHEDFSRDPRSRFRALYEALGLEFTADAEAAVSRSSDSANPREAPAGASAWRLDSRATVASWKRRLTPTEIAWLRDAVEDVSRTYYSDDDW